MKRLIVTLAAALAATVIASPVAAQVTGTLTGPSVLPEGGLIAVKIGKCGQPFGNWYCEYRSSEGRLPFARTGRFTVTLTNEGGTEATANFGFFRVSGSGNGCSNTIPGTSEFRWRSANLEAIGVPDQATFNYAVPVAANSTRVIRFEMASEPDHEVDGDCVWNFGVNTVPVATLTIQDDEARPYVGPVPGPHPYGGSWPRANRPSCLKAQGGGGLSEFFRDEGIREQNQCTYYTE